MKLLSKDAICRLYDLKDHDDIFEVVSFRRTKLDRLIVSLINSGLFSRRESDPYRAALSAWPIVFVHVPKNAGTSISLALYDRQIQHKSYRCLATFMPDILSDRETFATWRDPERRFISAYKFLRTNGTEVVGVSEKFAALLEGRSSIDDYLDFVERADRIFDLDFTLRPQGWFLKDADGAIRIDRLFDISSGNGRLREYLGDHGVTDLPHANASRREDIELSDSQRKRIRAIYADDYELQHHLE